MKAFIPVFLIHFYYGVFTQYTSVVHHRANKNETLI